MATIHDLRVKKFATIVSFAKALKVSTYKASQWDKSQDMTLCYFQKSSESRKHISNLAAVLNVSFDTVVDCLKAVWPYQFKDAPPLPPPPSMPSSIGPHAVLYVTSNAPQEVIQAAYRALAKKYHPDNGGSHDAMKRINEAYRLLAK